MNNHLEPRISEKIVPEVFDLAARLYAEKNQGYSSEELMEAGVEVKIPPEFIQQAIAQVQSQQIQKKQAEQLYKPTNKSKLFGIAALLLLGSILAWTVAELRPAKTDSTSSSSSSSTSSSSSSSSSQEKRLPTQTDLRGADLRQANLEGANLKGKNLSSTNLTRANLEDADLSGTNLRDANLMRANLENANLSSANLNGANLNGANLEGATMPDKTDH